MGLSDLGDFQRLDTKTGANSMRLGIFFMAALVLSPAAGATTDTDDTLVKGDRGRFA